MLLHRWCCCVLLFVFVAASATSFFVYASSHNLGNRNISNVDGITVNVQSQRFIRYYNTTYDTNKASWSSVYTATSPISLTTCANLCMENEECVCFLFNKKVQDQPNCFLGNTSLRGDHLTGDTDMDYFELEVSSFP